MDDRGLNRGYERPAVRDYGDLVKLTGDAGMLHVGIGSPMLAASSPGAPGGGGASVAGPGPGGSPANVAGTTQAGQNPLAPLHAELPGTAQGNGTDPGGTAGTNAGGGGSGGGGGLGAGAGGGGTGGGRGGGGGGGSLPFTGLAVGAVAAAGAGLTAAGTAVRRWLRRGEA